MDPATAQTAVAVAVAVAVAPDPAQPCRDIVEYLLDFFRLHPEWSPPYSGPQLLAFVLGRQTTPVTFETIFNTLLTDFQYHQNAYNREAFKSVCRKRSATYNHVPPNKEVVSFAGKVAAALGTFEVPVELHEDKGVLRWSMSPVQAAYLLDFCFGERRPTGAGFFDLASEVRNKIYEYAFTYPKCGLEPQTTWNYEQGCHETSFRLVTRSYDADFSFEAFNAGPARTNAYVIDDIELGTSCKTKTLRNILKPLTVSKQFRYEAIPFFYTHNRFYFDNINEMHQMLCGLARTKRSFYIRHLAFKYTGREKNAVRVFNDLRRLKNLRSLAISVKEGYWVGSNTYRAFTDVTKMTGFRNLRAIRGLKDVTVVGLEAAVVILKNELVQEKEAKAGGGTGGAIKRKAEDEGDGQNGGDGQEGEHGGAVWVFPDLTTPDLATMTV